MGNLFILIDRLEEQISARRGRLDRLFGPHRADVDNGAATVGLHVLCHRLGDEKKAFVEIEIFITLVIHDNGLSGFWG